MFDYFIFIHSIIRIFYFHITEYSNISHFCHPSFVCQVNRGFFNVSKKYCNSFEDFLFCDSMQSLMYHMIDDNETPEEEENSKNVIKDVLAVEKKTTMGITGQS